MRGEVIAAFGAAVGTFVQGLYVVDFLPRVRAALDGFFGTSSWPVADATTFDGDLWAALAFTDGMIWTPGRIEPGTYDAVSQHFAPEARVELILDITRNALNKVAVAMKADDPHVTEGYEIYDIEPNADLVYGLSLA